jgi:hypothetical protein
MTPAQDYIDRVGAVLGSEFIDGRLRLEISTGDPKEAKAISSRLVQQQKQLRQIKKEIALDMKAIRVHYKAEAASVEASLFTTIFGGSRNNAANKRRAVNAQRDRTLYPYEAAKNTIDDLLTQMDGAKLKIKEWLSEQ